MPGAKLACAPHRRSRSATWALQHQWKLRWYQGFRSNASPLLGILTLGLTLSSKIADISGHFLTSSALRDYVTSRTLGCPSKSSAINLAKKPARGVLWQAFYLGRVANRSYLRFLFVRRRAEPAARSPVPSSSKDAGSGTGGAAERRK